MSLLRNRRSWFLFLATQSTGVCSRRKAEATAFYAHKVKSESLGRVLEPSRKFAIMLILDFSFENILELT